jgi:hypothetical protein
MKSMLFIAIAFSILETHARAPIVVAAIDSNFDLTHSAVEYRTYKNTAEIPGDGIDNDNNGFIDDIIGWDIRENDPGIVLSTPLEFCNEECRKFGELHFKRRVNQASEEELLWLSEHNDLGTIFFNYLTRFHGLAIIERMIRHTTHSYWVGLKFYEDFKLDSNIPAPKFPKTTDIETIYQTTIDYMVKPFERASKYLSHSQVRVVNNSYYYTKSVAEEYLQMIYKDATGEEISPDLLAKLAERGFHEFIERSSKMIIDNPNILFIAATDNAGANLDKELYFPQHVKADNLIVVQASNNLAPIGFTGFGEKSVDIAAPAVNQFYATPGNMYAIASATSLAAPFVSNVATRMLEINPDLTPAEIKSIIRNTAWFLPDFAKLNSTSGVINPEACYKKAKH